jgi:hypothetical protein
MKNILQINLEAYKILIDDYTPTTKVIEKKLEELESAEDKIKYLKSEEIKYLIDVSMNPMKMAVSGIVTTNNPHKAGLDRWIEYKIWEVKNSANPSKVEKNTAYTWIGNTDKELPKLYSQLRNYKIIAIETAYELFQAVLTGKPIEQGVSIKWNESNRLLAYFLDCVFSGQDWQSIAGNGKLFSNKKDKPITANDLSVAKSNYLAYGLPKGYEKIDLIIRTIKKD